MGCTLVLKMKCSAGHVFTWCSSPTLTNANQQSIYKINMEFASAVLFSGNNYYKIRQFCRFMGMDVVSPSTFFTYQRLCLCPVISDYYNRKMVRLSIPILMLLYVVYVGVYMSWCTYVALFCVCTFVFFEWIVLHILFC